MKVEFGKFFEQLIEHGKPITDESINGVEMEHRLPVDAYYASRLHDLLVNHGSDMLFFDGRRFSMVETEKVFFITSDAAFNVTGFTGHINTLKGAFAANINKAINAFNSMSDAFVALAPPLPFDWQEPEQPIIDSDFNKKLIRVAVDGIGAYIGRHLAYNLIDPESFKMFYDDGFISSMLKDVLGISLFHQQELSENDLDVETITSYIISHFDEDVINKATTVAAAEYFAGSYASKKSYKSHDSFKIKLYRDVSALACFKAFCADRCLYNLSRAIVGPDDECHLFSGGEGESFVVGNTGVKTKFYKNHVTLSLPKSISQELGVFVNMYAKEELVKWAERIERGYV